MSHVTPTLFAVLVWGTIAAVALLFVALLYTVLRAGSIRLVEDHGP